MKNILLARLEKCLKSYQRQENEKKIKSYKNEIRITNQNEKKEIKNESAEYNSIYLYQRQRISA